MSQYVIFVESSSLIYYRSFSLFVCSTVHSSMGNLYADKMFRTTNEAKSEGLDSLKHV